MAVVYSDVNPNYGVSSTQLILVNEEAVNAELENCLGISVGEHWWEPTFGSDLRLYLFEQVDDITAALIWMEVLDRIPLWMPHITLLKGTGVYADYDEQLFRVEINYAIRANGVRGTFVAEMPAGLGS